MLQAGLKIFIGRRVRIKSKSFGQLQQLFCFWTFFSLSVLHVFRLGLGVEGDQVVDAEDRDGCLRGELYGLDLAHGRLEHTGLEVVLHLALIEIQTTPVHKRTNEIIERKEKKKRRKEEKKKRRKEEKKRWSMGMNVGAFLQANG